eukprot:2608342-Amphidinium_carterae.1
MVTNKAPLKFVAKGFTQNINDHDQCGSFEVSSYASFYCFNRFHIRVSAAINFYLNNLKCYAPTTQHRRDDCSKNLEDATRSPQHHSTSKTNTIIKTSKSTATCIISIDLACHETYQFRPFRDPMGQLKELHLQKNDLTP